MRTGDIPLTVTDVQHLADIANMQKTGGMFDAATARTTLIEAAADRKNFVDEAAYEQAKFVVSFFRRR